MHMDIKVGPPSAPGNNATVTLLDTTKVFGQQGLRANGIHRVILAFPGLSHASATGGLLGYVSPDHGTNWYRNTFAPSGDPAALPLTVNAATATDFDTFDIDVTAFDDVKFTFTAGATGPTTWKPTITLELKRVAGT